MSELIIRRVDDSAGVLRRMRILVDGVEVAKLRPGRRTNVSVPPGVHRIRAQLDWCSSDDLDVEIGIASECAIEVEFPFSAVLRVFYRPKGTIKIRKVN
jgi:hypothetical protein